MNVKQRPLPRELRTVSSVTEPGPRPLSLILSSELFPSLFH